jgi:hypothetical protein
MSSVFFVQQQGGAIFLAVRQNLFSQHLVKRLSGIAGLDKQVVIHNGAMELRKTVPANEILTVVNAYSYSLTRVFILAAALGACMIIATPMVEWRSMEKQAGPPIKENKDVEKDARSEKETVGDKESADDKIS